MRKSWKFIFRGLINIMMDRKKYNIKEIAKSHGYTHAFATVQLRHHDHLQKTISIHERQSYYNEQCIDKQISRNMWSSQGYGHLKKCHRVLSVRFSSFETSSLPKSSLRFLKLHTHTNTQRNFKDAKRKLGKIWNHGKRGGGKCCSSPRIRKVSLRASLMRMRMKWWVIGAIRTAKIVIFHRGCKIEEVERMRTSRTRGNVSTRSCTRSSQSDQIWDQGKKYVVSTCRMMSSDPWARRRYRELIPRCASSV